MALLAIIIAFCLEQIRPLALNNFMARLLLVYLKKVAQLLDAGQQYLAVLVWGLGVLLPAIIVGIINLVLYNTGYLLFGSKFVGSIFSLSWSIFILYTCIGFRQFSHNFTAIRQALDLGDENTARQRLAKWKQVDVATLSRSEIMRYVIEYSVLSAHKHVFGPIFWFCFFWLLGLGPAGAIFYRQAEFAARYFKRKSKSVNHVISNELKDFSKLAWIIVDYLPARMTASAFAIVGSFEDAIDVWRTHAARFKNMNDGIIICATAGAIGVKLGGASLKPLVIDKNKASSFEDNSTMYDEANKASELNNAGLPGDAPNSGHFTQIVALVWRSVAFYLMLLAIFTISSMFG